MKRLPALINKIFRTILLLALSGSTVFAQDEVFLRVERNAKDRIPLEIRPCKLAGDALAAQGDSILKILEDDLWASSLIAPYLLSGGRNGRNREVTPVRTAVNTTLVLNGAKVLLRGEIVNKRTKRLLKRKIYRGCLEKLRLLVHRYADDVVNTLTGQEGIAKSRIAFTAKSFGATEIYIMDYDGGNLQKLTDDGSLNLAPAWSRTGERISFTSFKNDNPDLFTIDVASRKAFPVLQRHALFTSPAWSPDGKKMAFVSTHAGNAEIYSLQVKERKITRLTYHGAIESAPDWSPTGREIVFTSDRLGKPKIFVMSSDGGNVRGIETGTDYNDSPVWSPRGDKIAFVARSAQGFDIYTFDTASFEVRRLTQNQGSNEDPCWSPDGFQLAFTSTRAGKKDVYRMLWDGTQIERLTNKGTCASPAWSPNQRLEKDFKCLDK